MGITKLTGQYGEPDGLMGVSIVISDKARIPTLILKSDILYDQHMRIGRFFGLLGQDEGNIVIMIMCV